MSCDVCLSGADADSEFNYDRQYTARKTYTCEECRSTIQVGDTYRRLGGKCDGYMWHEIVCKLCHEINMVFSCDNGTMWGNLWTDIYDYIFPDLRVTTPCFNKLSMPARAKITEQWWKWKGLQEPR